MKEVNFKSPLKFKLLLKVHFEKETFSLISIDNTYHTIRINSVFAAAHDKEAKNLLYDLKEMLGNELPDYLFTRVNHDLIVDGELQMAIDDECNIYFSKVVEKD